MHACSTFIQYYKNGFSVLRYFGTFTHEYRFLFKFGRNAAEKIPYLLVPNKSMQNKAISCKEWVK